MAGDPPLLLSREGAVATVTLNRPDTKNALNRDLVLKLGSTFETIGRDREVRAVIVTGAGGAFCSGADLRSAAIESPGGVTEERVEEFHAVIRAIIHAPKPFVAAVDGPAVGFGADVALACDLRVLSSRGYIHEKFVKIGLMPDGGGTFWMARLVGLGRALEFLLLGTKIEADRAYELGLANRVVEPALLEETARELASTLAEGPPLAHEAIRHAVRDSFGGSIDEALKRELEGQVRLLGTKDVMEGVLAWAQRREPRFKGE